jgi:hypothetical protein
VTNIDIHGCLLGGTMTADAIAAAVLNLCTLHAHLCALLTLLLLPCWSWVALLPIQTT